MLSRITRINDSIFALGHTKLLRITAAEREEKKRLDKKEKKEYAEEEERNRMTYNFVKYPLGLKHQVLEHLVYFFQILLFRTAYVYYDYLFKSKGFQTKR